MRNCHVSSSCVVQGMLVEVGKVGGKLSLENGVRNCIAYIYIYIIIIIFQEILQTWRVTLHLYRHLALC